MSVDRYQDRIAEELANYADVENVADLPAIALEWSPRHLTPLLEEAGIGDPGDYFVSTALERARAHPDRDVDAVSLGAGNCELEVRITREAADAGLRNLRVTCLEINEAMRARGLSRAVANGVEEAMRFLPLDLNSWAHDRVYDVVIATHSLHHVLELEHLLDEVRSALTHDGVLLVNDMIGRNGHMRWPEAKRLVDAVWEAMPDRYRFHHQLRQHHRHFVNWDCSAVGFEGIRAQDILPLLLERFCPERFVAFSGIIGVFLDRGYGPNFDPRNPEDATFIEYVSDLDRVAIDLGIVKPTQLIASFRTHPVDPVFPRHWSPRFCVRDPSAADSAVFTPDPVVDALEPGVEEEAAIAVPSPPATPPPGPPLRGIAVRAVTRIRRVLGSARRRLRALRAARRGRRGSGERPC